MLAILFASLLNEERVRSQVDYWSIYRVEWNKQIFDC